MKKIKFMSLALLVLGLSTGCFKRDTLENIDIITSVYPVEYVSSVLYGEHSTVASIYPNDTDSFNYQLTNKQVSDYSKKDLFIYNGITDDKEIAFEFLEKNKNLLIIDATYGMDITYHEAELWLNPSNLLMLSQNIRNGLKEYITNNYLKKEIDKNYEDLKVELSEVDAELRLTANNAKRKTIIVNSDALKFLEKYGFKVISLDDKNTAISNKVVEEVNDLIASGEVNTIFLLENEKNSTEVKQIIENKNVTSSIFRRIDTIKDEERKDKNNYISIMNNNIELLKKELYE